MIDIPGQKTDEAIGNIITEAGKSLIRGLGRLAGAQVARSVATKEAEAQAARLAIETRAEIGRSQALHTARRETELQKIDHEGDLLERRLDRLRHELTWQQANIETISNRALETTERDPKAESAREIHDDWLFRFARYAQEISDNEVQQLWARILSSAAIGEKLLVSPAALQTMSLLDSRVANDFMKFSAAVETFGFCPVHDELYSMETQGIDLKSLEELGLVHDAPISGRYEFRDFSIGVGPVPGTRIDLLHTAFVLTKRGRELADAVFRGTDLGLSDADQQSYLRDVISAQMRHYPWLELSPLPEGDQVFPSVTISISHRRNASPLPWEERLVGYRASSRLRQVLSWARSHYEISVKQNVPPLG